ncbi:hypothetical protein AMJ80_01855 [bacterium SM23_31]|nr:MAG: hypothetical protein AMJ80_01855 [bacterium SM23_31]
MKIITLLTDFGTQDGYAGTMKGVILGINPHVTIIDISHEIPKWDIKAAAFVLHSAYRYFPSGTIHVIVVDPGVGSEREILAVQTKDYLFLAPDNELLSLIFEHERDCMVYRMTHREKYLADLSQTFHGRDIFAPVAAYLSKNVPLSEIGEPYQDAVCGLIPKPKMDLNKVAGEIVYQDGFGNLISNISKYDLAESGISENAVISIKGKTIHGLRTSYSSLSAGELLALISSAGFLEIACNKCSAADILQAGAGTKVVIRTS